MDDIYERPPSPIKESGKKRLTKREILALERVGNLVVDEEFGSD